MRKLQALAGLVGILLIATACGTASSDDGITPTPPIGAQLTTTDAPTTSGITVSGRGEVSGVPDTLTVTLGISLVRPGVGEAVEAAAERADLLISALDATGVAEADMQTANYSVHPEYDYRSDERRLIGYRVTNTLTVKIRDLESAGEVIDAATGAGGDDTTVNGVSFSLEDNEDLITTAREAAWLDARTKADQLAGLAGVTLGAPVSITESFSTAPPVIQARALEAAVDIATPIMAGEEAVTVQLTVVFSITG